MPTYIRKTIKLLPWVNLNISKTGPSLSIGPRGAKLNISRKGVYVNSATTWASPCIISTSSWAYAWPA